VIRNAGELSPNGVAGVYESWQCATDELRQWVKTHRNKKGNPTVAGFDGPTWSNRLVLDFDKEGAPEVPLGWLRQVLTALEDAGVDLRALRIAFSGLKGFSLEIPAALFGGFEPSAEFHSQAKRAAELIMGSVPFDRSVYDKLRLWRVLNSQHEKSGRYKIPLSASEALTLDMAAILVLANQPRPITEDLTPLADDDLLPVPELVAIWQRATEPAETAPGSAAKYRAKPIENDERDRQTVGAIVAAWPDRSRGLSRHTDYLTPLAGFLTGRTTTEHAQELLCRAAKESGDASFLTSRDWESEIARLVDGSATRRSNDQPFTGLPALSSQFPTLAAVLAVLWPTEHLGADPGRTNGTDTPTAPRSYETPWPEPLADEAYHGLLGELVHAIEPYSEADPAALLAHALSGVSALVHSGVKAIAGDAEHPARIWTVNVGETAKGRKGSAAKPNQRILTAADLQFQRRMLEGASSGEGLIWQVRNPIMRWEKVGRGADKRSELVEVDPGESDKRLWAIESEFASVLRQAQREGNTLSTIMRRAWDSGDLQSLTKNSPAKATDAHIVITGHITRDELLRYLDRSELASGFANRFLWFAVRRGQLLPDGGMVPSEIVNDLGVRLHEVRIWANTVRTLRRNDEAADVWREVYEQLSDGKPGMLGAATNRAEAQVLRLSVLYAICDQSAEIRAEHLMAALAVWRYCEASARWVFGDATGDSVADAILQALRRSGSLTRTEISQLFGRNQPAVRLDQALGLLLRAGLAKVERVQGEGGGRATEVWDAV
jgi:hypothetical protein